MASAAGTDRRLRADLLCGALTGHVIAEGLPVLAESDTNPGPQCKHVAGLFCALEVSGTFGHRRGHLAAGFARPPRAPVDWERQRLRFAQCCVTDQLPGGIDS